MLTLLLGFRHIVIDMSRATDQSDVDVAAGFRNSIIDMPCAADQSDVDFVAWVSQQHH